MEEEIKGLRESLEWYKIITENANDLIAIMNQKFEFSYINEKPFLKLLGYLKGEVLGKSSLQFVHPADQEHAINAFLKGFETGGGKIEVRVKHKDGHYLWLGMQGQVFTDKKNEKKAIIIARDITENKYAEEALQESEARYKAIFDRTLYSIYIHDFKGNIIDANDTALNMLGYSRNDISSLNFVSLMEDAQMDIAFKDIDYLLGHAPQNKSRIFKLRRKDGNYIWVETEASLIYRQGKPYAILGIAKDITERKLMDTLLQESEKKYRTIIEGIGDAVVIMGFDGKFQFISPQLFTMLGRSEIGSDLSEFHKFIHKDDLNQLYGLFQKVIQEKTVIPGKEIEFRALHQNGHFIWLASSSKEHYDENGKLIGFISILRDITERKEAEEIRIKLLEEMKSRKELEEISRLKDEFYADISHELRTPLTIIRGFIELIAGSPNLDETQKTDLQIILKNEMRLEHLINEMLDYSRLKSGQIQFQIEPFRVSEIVNEIKTEFKPIIEPKHLVFEEEFNPDIELVLDKNQMMKVIKNLLSNAIKFSFPSRKISIKSLIENGIWTFSIQDQGIGILEKDIPNLFSRFIKLRNAENMNPNGIGIGLAICRKIIDLYTGKIWVESTGLNKGSIFIFQIKLDKKIT